MSSVGLLVQKYEEKYSLVKQKMRDRARVLLQLRKTDSNPVSQLPDLISPGRFDNVVNAIKTAKFHFDQGVQKFVSEDWTFPKSVYKHTTGPNLAKKG